MPTPDPMSHLGRVGDDGKFIPLNPSAFRFAFAPFKGIDVVLTIEAKKATRTNRQNRAFWGIVVRAFCEYMGYRFASARDKEFVKDQILIAIGHYDIKRGLGGKEIKVVKSTHNLPTMEFKELYESCQMLGAENGLVIPDPESPIAMGVKRA